MIQKRNVLAPTDEAYADLTMAFDHFNAALFDNTVPKCLFTLQRKKMVMGYFSPNRFVNLDGTKCHEVALNPLFFAVQSVEQICATLVHEQTHAWQFACGNPGRSRYHNSEWADRMEAIGLMPSSTGVPGGKRTGDHMSDYPLPGGRFEIACKELLATKFRVRWLDRFPLLLHPISDPSLLVASGNIAGVSLLDQPLSRSQLTQLAIQVGGDQVRRNEQSKYCCVLDGVNVWGKPNLKIICGLCRTRLKEQRK